VKSVALNYAYTSSNTDSHTICEIEYILSKLIVRGLSGIFIVI